MYLLAIDQGTTSSRAVIYDQELQVMASAQKEIQQSFPQSGWVEHDPNEIWQSVQSVMADSLITSNIRPDEIKAIGITNQRETTVVWDKKSGQAIYPAIVWQSRQSAPYAKKLQDEGLGSWIQEKTGLVIDAYFSATKIRFILDQVEGAQERAENGELLFGTIDTWLLWKLTDGEQHKTDYTNASRTMLFNCEKLAWDEDILAKLNIPKKMLPEVCSNAGKFGATKPFHFFGQKVPICGMAGDQQAALIGQMAFEKGETKSTYGTGAFIVMNTGHSLKRSDHQLLSTVAYHINGEVCYALEGSIFVAGSAIQWLRDGLQLFEKAEETQALALKASDNDNLYVVPAFTGLGAPYWDPEARGAMFGITRSTTKEDLVKATLQAVAYQVKDILTTMEKDTHLPLKILKVDGGAARNDYLLQFQADLLNLTVQRPENIETTALGAAILAGLGLGWWKELAEVKQLTQVGKIFKPEMNEETREKLYAGWKQAVTATQLFKMSDEPNRSKTETDLDKSK
ncbi:glycerol kinase GlpK [Enterococcus timonensis]|uniref:glycerol kinase GlpK n=1 Tax=Enterococcus timonensis TaxID=1852364 RepID=UPI0008DAC29D|nr:glycerol kinase GlpK [Enterococcus timonensis]